MTESLIEAFLQAVRRRLDDGVRWRVISRTLLAGATAALVWALAWRVFGYAAPRPGYAVVAAVAVIAAIVWIMASRRNTRDAAHSADSVFNLKDGMISWLDFKSAGLDGEAYQLNERALVEQMETLDVTRVPAPKPRKLLASGVAVALLAFGLALLPHGEAVRKRLAREQLASQRSAEIAKELEKAVEEIIETMSEEERELLAPKTLREWAKQIQATKDMRESEKQLARFEQQIAKAMQGLEARQDEAVLKLSAEELAKSSMADARKLGKNLEAKDFEKAAQNLNAIKPKAARKMTPEELAKLRKNAAKSRDMAKRMADGARRKDFGNMKPGDDKNAKPGEKAMDEMLEEMDADAADLAMELEESEFDEDAEAMAGKLEKGMGELGKRLGKLAARQKAKGKLNALRGGLGQARQFAKGNAQSLGLAQGNAQGNQPGGQQAGTGSDSSRRDQRDEFKDNGNMAQLKGQQNAEGPSSSTVESAESGSGVAGRANVAKQREFKQQLESLVRRDDIPESLKLGVREYFEKVHGTEPASK